MFFMAVQFLYFLCEKSLEMLMKSDDLPHQKFSISCFRNLLLLKLAALKANIRHRFNFSFLHMPLRNLFLIHLDMSHYGFC